MAVPVGRPIAWLAAALCCVTPGRASGPAQDVRVAVAASFKPTAEALCDAYFATRPGRCVITAGASGLLYAKAAQGAPFDVFLSADRARAGQLESAGIAVPGSRFTYAIGRLVLWHPDGAPSRDLRTALTDPALRTLAIANPGAAPYGAAALQTLHALGIDPAARYRVVRGESAAQAFQFVATGAADAGFVALSQVLEYRARAGRSLEAEVIEVQAGLHAPIEQQAVLLEVASGNAAAAGLLQFMRTDSARRIIAAAGYSIPAR